MIDFLQKLESLKTQKARDLLVSQISEYEKNYNKTISDYNTSIGSWNSSSYDSDYKNKYDSLTGSVGEIKSNAKDLIRLIEANKEYLEDEYDNVYKYLVDSKNNLNSIKSNLDSYNSFYSQFKDNDAFLDWSYGNKYKGKTATEIDEIIKSLSEKPSAAEARWLLQNRDYFMTTDEIEKEIKSLEDKSFYLDVDKLEEGATNFLKMLGKGSLITPNAEYDYSASEAEAENNARLKHLKELLATKPDFDAEKAYKEADGKNLLDVITTDYTYADYLNDKDSKNIYGNAVVRQRDEENFKIIENNYDSFSKDYSAVINIISNKKLASDLASSSVGGSIANALNDSERSEQIFSTDPEIQSIVKKWSDMGYDFKSLYDSYERKSNTAYTDYINSSMSDFAKNHPVLGNIASVGTNLIGGFSALPSALKTGIQDATSDDIVTLDTNAPEWALKNVTDSIRDTTSKMISENNEGLKGEFYNFLYQTGMSAADMGASFVAGGFNSTVYPLIMFSNAAADKIKTVTENGGSVDEALLSGLMAGAFEAIFEKIGIDKLVETVTSSAGKSVFKSFLNGFLSEGLEELGTDIANSVSDALINGNNSEFNNKIYAYMQDGHSAKEAKALALTDLAKQYMSSFAGGALTGGMISGVGGGINKAVYNSQIRDIGKSINESGNIQELINYAKESGYDADKVEKLYENSSVAKKLHEIAVAEAQEKATSDKNNNAEVDASIEETKNRLGIGQRIADRRSNYATGKLYADVQNNISDTATANIKSAVMQKLTENGIDNANAQKYTDLILKSAKERLSASEIRELNNNTLALNMAQELMNGSFELDGNAILSSAQAIRKSNSNISEEQKNATNEQTAEPTSPAITADADTVLEARESVKNIYGDAGARTIEYLVQNYDDNEDAIRNLFDEYYVAGSLGETDINNVTQRTGITLAPEIQQEIKNQAFAAGISDYHASSQSARGTNAVRKGSVTVSESVSTQITDEEKSFLDLFANTLGVEIYVVPEIFASGKKAEGKYSDGKLYLSEDVFKGDLWASIFSHELGHHLSETAPEQWRNYKKFVIENMRSNPQRYASILAKKKIEYRQVQNNILDMEIMDEIACDCLELFLYDSKFTSEMIKRDRSFVEKLRDWLKNFVAQLSEAIHSFSNKQSARVLNSVMQQRDNYAAGLALVNSLLEQGAKTVDQAMSQNAEKSENETNKNTADEDGGVKYSIENDKVFDDYCKTIEDIAKSDSIVMKGEYIKVSTQTPRILIDKANAKNLPIVMMFDIAYLETRQSGKLPGNYHNLGSGNMKKLPLLLESPEYIVQLENGRLNVIVNLATKKGSQALVSIELEQSKQVDGKFNEYNIVLTAFGAKSGYIERIIKNPKNRILYTKETEPQGTDQLHIWLDGINDSVSNNRISQNDSTVNTHSMQDSKKDTNEYSFEESDIEFIEDEVVSEQEAAQQANENEMAETIYNLIKIEKPSKKAIYEVSQKILSNTASRMSAKEFAGKLSQLLDYIENGEADIASIQNETRELARQVISRSDYTDNSAWEQYKDVRKQILRKTFYVNRSDIGAEDIKQAALLAGRRFYITTDTTRRGDIVLDIDEIYEDLHNNNPEFFPDTDSPMQQIENISVFLSATSKRVDNPYASGEMGMSEDFAADILAGQIYHTVVTGIIDRSNGIRTVDITNAKEVASRYYKGIEQLKRQAARYSKDYEKFAREQKDKTIAYRELARKQVADKKAEIMSGAERRQLISSLKRLYKDSVNLLMGKRNDRLGTPQELKSALFDVVELVNLQNGMYPGSKYNDTILSMRTRIHNMRETLVNYKKETDAEGNEVVSEYAVDTLEALRKSTQDGKKTIDLLSNDELRNLINVLQHVKGLVTDANKMFTEKLNADYDKLGNAVINELKGKKEHLGSTNSLKTLITTNQLMPEYFFERIGGTLENLFRNIYNTEGEQFRILQRFVADASDIAEKYKFNEWGLKETKLEYTTSRGEKMNIDLFNVMSLYALYKRERSNFGTISETMHVLHGGEIEFTEDLGVWKEAMNNGAASIRNHNSKNSKVQKTQDKLAAEGKGDSPTKSYFLSEQDVKNLIGMLGDKQKAFADSMIRYLSNDVAAVGNEASRAMFNHDIFLEKCYFPISVNKTHLATNIDANTKPKQVQNASMTKHVSTFADTAIVLRSFMDVWIEHVNQMSVYAATSPALKDFMRVYNYKTKPPVENKTGNVSIDESERQNTKAYSVKALIKEKFGADYTEYIEELMRDLNGGYRNVNEFGPLINATKKTAVALSLSCAIQQPAAMARAFSILDVKNFANYSKKGYDEMMKYSAIAQIKSTNGYDTLSGPSLLYEIVNHNNEEKYAQTKMFIKCVQNHNWKMASQFTDEFLFYLPKKMDEITWTAIWNSCKKQVRKEGKFKTENEAFFKAVTEVFENVVRRTQVYDSTFQKSGNLRSKSQLVNMEMAFMTEPTVSWNMLLDAKQKLQAGDKRAATRIVTSVAVSSVCAIILKSFIGAMRKIEKDDDAEDFLSSWLDLSTQNGVSELFGFLPIIKDIYSIFDGFSIERMEFANIERLINAIKGLDSEKKTMDEKITDIAASLANIFGVPGTTIVRGIRSSINITHNIMHFADEPYTKAMLEATKKGDAKTLTQIYNEQIANGLTKATILKQYRQSMVENIPEIAQAVDLLSRGDETAYYKKCREIIDMGFDYSDIKAAINLLLDEKNDKQNASLLAKAHTWIKSSFDFDYVAADIEVPEEFYNSTFFEMVDSVIDGDSSSFTDMYNQLIADGYSESQINSGYREAMAEMLPEVADAAKFYKEGQMGSYSIALSEITKQGFNLSDAKAAVKKYLELDNVEMSEGEKFAASRISDIGNNINQGSDVFVQEELFDGAVYDYDMMYYVLVEQGSNSVDYKTIEKYFLDNGKTKKSLTTAMENRAKKTVKRWINAVNVGDTTTYQKCLKELTTFYGSQSEAVSVVNKYRSEQESLIKKYLNSSGNKQSEAKEELISEYGDWSTAQKAIDYYQKH